MEHAGEHLREFRISHGSWSNHVYRPAGLFIRNCGLQQAHYVVKRDPRHPLLAASQPPAEAQLEGRKHLRQRASLCRKNHSKSRDNRANAARLRAESFGFPVTASIGQKIVSAGARFSEDFVAAIAVITDRRGRDEYSRFLFQARESIHKHAGDINPAAAKDFFSRGIPAAAPDARAVQIYYRVGAFHGIRVYKAAGGVPANVARRRLAVRSNQKSYSVTFAAQRFSQRRPTRPDPPEIKTFMKQPPRRS